MVQFGCPRVHLVVGTRLSIVIYLSKSALVEKMVGFAKYDENLRDMICRVVKNTGICLSFYDVKFEKFERRNLSFSCVYIL